ncbi:MAG TPA: YebC/PmpR family DNA-binding transcriptional regulator [Firmicutes bacterium]|nr:YebC/PmpR family DNA-binding transcriptional regulator [Bacillota bacterium]
MGRAFEVRKASIQKNGAARGKVYTTFAKEIYLVCKRGGTDIEANVELKRVVAKAKKQQVPNDIIERAITKAKGAGGEDYKEVIYEGFGPGASTLVIKTLTDNVNRTVGEVRAAFNKVHKSLGVSNSVTYNYDNLSIIGIKSDKESELFEALLDAGIEIHDLENEDGLLVVTADSKDASKVKDVIEKMFPDVELEIDEIGMYPKEKIILEGEDRETFDKLYKMLDEIDDVTEIYTNVTMD